MFLTFCKCFYIQSHWVIGLLPQPTVIVNILQLYNTLTMPGIAIDNYNLVSFSWHGIALMAQTLKGTFNFHFFQTL